MVEFICLLLGIVVLIFAVWFMNRNEKAAMPVAVGIMAIPVIPLTVFGLVCGDSVKAAICLTTAAMYGGIMYALFRRR